MQGDMRLSWCLIAADAAAVLLLLVPLKTVAACAT